MAVKCESEMEDESMKLRNLAKWVLVLKGKNMNEEGRFWKRILSGPPTLVNLVFMCVEEGGSKAHKIAFGTCS